MREFLRDVGRIWTVWQIVQIMVVAGFFGSIVGGLILDRPWVRLTGSLASVMAAAGASWLVARSRERRDREHHPINRLVEALGEPGVVGYLLPRPRSFSVSPWVIVRSAPAIVGVANRLARWVPAVERRALDAVVAARDHVAREAQVDGARLSCILLVERRRTDPSTEVATGIPVQVTGLSHAADLLRALPPAPRDLCTRLASTRFDRPAPQPAGDIPIGIRETRSGFLRRK